MPKTLPPKVTVRRAAARDEKRWRELFDGYCLFYKRTPSEPLTRHTWARILADASPIHAIVAEDRKDGVITQGELILTLDGKETRYRAGEWYQVRAKATHAARFEVETSEIWRRGP